VASNLAASGLASCSEGSGRDHDLRGDEGENMADSATGPPDASRWQQRALRWWAAGLAFVVGLVAGAVLVGLLSDGATVPPGTTVDAAPTGGGAEPAEPDGAEESSSGAPGGATGEVRVNASCLRTINAAQDVFEAVEDLGEALAGFNAGLLDEIVRELQPLQQRLQTNLEGCDVAADLPDLEPGTGSASPTGGSPDD
jgi:hypothetical protein